MRWFLIAGLVLGFASTNAQADKLVKAPEIGPRVKLSKRIQRNLGELGNNVGLELGELTMGLVEMRFDIQKRDARFHLGGGNAKSFRLRLDSHVVVRKSQARVQARLDLAVAGYGFAVELPEFDMSTESITGQRAIALSIPFLEGAF
tara:strand:- start:5494 stop:5934 length:441 start_codon:yes stop_codon:yes gene_type:complete